MTEGRPGPRCARINSQPALVVVRLGRVKNGPRVGSRSGLTVLEAREGETGSNLDLAETTEQHLLQHPKTLRSCGDRASSRILSQRW